MPRICQHCRRANPHEARYCYHDGLLLEGQGGGAAIVGIAQPFTISFVLPSGRACRDFAELARACCEDSAAALDLLRRGHLESFLAGQGRSDLAAAARAAARAADRLRGLDEFLGRLPAAGLSPPKLRVVPPVIDLGVMRPGEDRRCELTLHNDGMRLLTGSAACDVSWLSLGDGPQQQSKLFELTNRLVLVVHVVGRQLRAREKPQEAQVLLESNGGKVPVTVRVHVPVKPFPEGVLAGALSPRQAAHKAKEAPKEAAVLLENGAVARWYEANGWTYPVLGPAAYGIAAVQQFLEALGLVKPPGVELSEDAIQLRGQPGEKIEYPLSVVTQENRAAWAFGTSDQPWLQIGKPIFRGRSAFLPLVVSAVPETPGTLQAIVSITANAGQRFMVPVTLEVSPTPVVQAARLPALPAGEPPAPRVLPPRSPAPPPPTMPTASTGWPVWLTLLPAFVLLLAVAGAGLRDYRATTHKAAFPSDKTVDSVPRIEIRFHDIKRDDDLEKLYLTDAQPTMRFGVVMLQGGKEVGQGARVRRLTFDPWGRTNNTCLRFDKDERLFGGPAGRWEESAARTWQEEKGQQHQGTKSVWICDDRKVEVTQLVELVRGEQSQLLDTCRVRYQLQNRDDKVHQVGIRFLLDTFIGGNDGVPFTIPGDSDLCDTLKDLPGQARDKKLPNFLQALEKPDLAHPGTIAHLRLKLENLEPPNRVTLGAWPNEKLRVLVRKNADGPATGWDVPLLPLKSLDLNDSALAIYWKEQPLGPGLKREVGFEYGLWNLASQGSRLAATIDGAFRPGGELTVVAYLARSASEEAETVTLTLPSGFQFLEGAQTQPVPPLPPDVRSGNVPVTWKVQVGATGRYELGVKSSKGAAQTLPVEIKKPIF